MAPLRRFLARLGALLRPSRAEHELNRELLSHLALLQDEFQRQGMTPEEAAGAARRASGGIELVRERHRDTRSFIWLEDARRDVAYAIRGLARAPGFTVVVVLTLALGIGANTAIFSVVNAVLLRQLPYPAGDRLVKIVEHVRPAAAAASAMPRTVGLNASEVIELRTHARTLSHIGRASGFPSLFTLTGRGDPVRLMGSRLSPSVFAMVDARPILGRTFKVQEESPGSDAVLVLSYSAWQRRLGGNPAIVGQMLSLDGRGYTVVGVMPPDFSFPVPAPDPQVEFAVPFPLATATPRATGQPVARLTERASIEAASAEVAAMLRRLRNAPDAKFDLIQIQDDLVEPVRPALLVLAFAVGLVLLIACVNVTNLLQSRTAARRREMAVRKALGAGRGRLLRQALTESLLLALLGGIAGAVVAFGAIYLLQTLAATLPRRDLYTGSGIGLPRLDEIGIDGTTFAFALGVSVVSGVLSGLAPAIRQSGVRQLMTLRGSEASALAGFDGPSRFRLQGALVIAEIAMAMILFVGGALLLRSFVTLARVDPGYDPRGLAWFQVFLPRERTPAQVGTFADAVRDRLRSLPGVRAAAYATQLPTGNFLRQASLRHRPEPTSAPIPIPGSPRPGVDARIVSRDFFQTMGIRVVAGRGFGDNDRLGQPQVMLINRTLARSGALGENPLGTQVHAIGTEPWQVVGIVDDVRQFGLERDPDPQIFVDFRQVPGPGPNGLYIAVRSQDNLPSLGASIKRLVGELDPLATLDGVATMEALLANTISRPRLYAVLLTIFAGIAVSLAAIGIFGMMAYAVAHRTREIGIRMALGAERSRVIGLVVRQSLVVTAIGIVLGLLGAASLTQILESMLFGVTPLDATTFMSVPVLFSAIALLASLVPARRATRIDPMVALRSE